MTHATWTATITTYLSTRQRTMTCLDCHTAPNHSSTRLKATHLDCRTGTGLTPPGPTGILPQLTNPTGTTLAGPKHTRTHLHCLHHTGTRRTSPKATATAKQYPTTTRLSVPELDCLTMPSLGTL